MGPRRARPSIGPVIVTASVPAGSVGAGLRLPRLLRRRGADHEGEGAGLDWNGSVYGDVLLLGVLVQCVGPALTAEPALLVTAEGVVRVDHVPVVDVDHPGLQAAGYVEGPLLVAAPDAGRPPVAGVIGDRDGLVYRVVGQDRQYGSEDLLPGDDHVVGH